MNSPCQNCDHPLDETFQYCPSCGQRAITRRLQLSEIIRDFWTQVTDIDKGLFTLLRDLVVGPGLVAREYIAGKRKKHFGPLNFYLIVGTLLILSMNVTGWIHATYLSTSSGSENSIVRPSTEATPETGQPHTDTSPGTHTESSDPKRSEQAIKISARRQATSKFWSQHSDLVSIAAAPLLCVFFWMFYRSAGFNYTELLIACLYMMGFTNLIYALIVSPLSSVLSSITSGKSTYIVTSVFKLFEITYFTYFCFQLTQGIVRRPLLRASIVSVLVAVFWTALTFFLMTLYILTGFGLD